MHILYIRNVNIRRSRYIIYLYRVYTIYSTHSTNERATICVTTILIEFRINTNLWMRRYSNIEWNISSTRIILRWNFTLHFSIFCRHHFSVFGSSFGKYNERNFVDWFRLFVEWIAWEKKMRSTNELLVSWSGRCTCKYAIHTHCVQTHRLRRNVLVYWYVRLLHLWANLSTILDDC